MVGPEQLHQQPIQQELHVHEQPRQIQDIPQAQPQQVAQDQLHGQQLAQNIARQLPAGDGNAMPPPGEQPVPVPEQAAHQSKAERRRLRRQQEAERLQREEAEREAQREQELELERQRREERQRLREERLQREEAERRPVRNALLSNEAVRLVMVELAQERDSQRCLEISKRLMHIAAETLLQQQPDLREGYANTARYSEHLMPFRLLIAREIQDDALAEQTMQELNEHETRFRENETENVQLRAITFSMPELFREEILNVPELKKAIDQMQIDFDQKNTEQMHRFGEFEKRVKRLVGGKPDDALLQGNSPYAQLGKRSTLERTEHGITAIMESQQCTRDEAQILYLQHQRQQSKLARELKAATRTAGDSTVKGMTANDVLTGNFCSYHYTLPAMEAEKVVQSSNGLLYAKDVGEGLCELRPTLPEMETLGGRQIPLRQTHNRMMRAIARMVIDENGKTIPGGDEVAQKIMDLHAMLDNSPVVSATEKIRQPLREVFYAQLEKEEFEAIPESVKQGKKRLLEQAKAEARVRVETVLDQIITYVSATLTTKTNNSANVEAVTALPYESLKQMRSHLQERAPGVEVPLEQRLQSVRAAMQAQGKDPEEACKAVTAMYADYQLAVQGLLDVRNMSIDDPDVALHNSCSANKLFYRGLRMGRGQVALPEIDYSTPGYIRDHPQQGLDFAIKLFSAPEASKGTLKKFQAMDARLKKGETLSNDELTTLTQAVQEQLKYPYHVAGNLGQTADGKTIVVEMFAAESTQYCIAPFSRKRAVGLYQGGAEGMKAHYHHDCPIPTEEAMLWETIKGELVNRSLPGDALRQ